MAIQGARLPGPPVIENLVSLTRAFSLHLSLLIVPVLSTLLGGILALRLRSSLGMLIALSTGLLLGAALLDLLPEAVTLRRLAGRGAGTVFALVLLSFLT